MCLIGNTEFRCMQCRGIGPHLAFSWKSHEFSRIAAGTWGIFSSYGGYGHRKLAFFSEVGLLSSYEGQLRNLN